MFDNTDAPTIVPILRQLIEKGEDVVVEFKLRTLEVTGKLYGISNTSFSGPVTEFFNFQILNVMCNQPVSSHYFSREELEAARLQHIGGKMWSLKVKSLKNAG